MHRFPSIPACALGAPCGRGPPAGLPGPANGRPCQLEALPPAGPRCKCSVPVWGSWPRARAGNLATPMYDVEERPRRDPGADRGHAEPAGSIPWNRLQIEPLRPLARTQRLAPARGAGAACAPQLTRTLTEALQSEPARAGADCAVVTGRRGRAGRQPLGGKVRSRRWAGIGRMYRPSCRALVTEPRQTRTWCGRVGPGVTTRPGVRPGGRGGAGRGAQILLGGAGRGAQVRAPVRPLPTLLVRTQAPRVAMAAGRSGVTRIEVDSDRATGSDCVLQV